METEKVLPFIGTIEVHGRHVRIRVYNEYSDELALLKGRTVAGIILLDVEKVECPILKALVRRYLRFREVVATTRSNS